VQENPRPLFLLTHDEFAQLSTDEKVMYLARAMEALAEEHGVVFASPGCHPTRTLQ
jgi:hypothetical protein